MDRPRMLAILQEILFDATGGRFPSLSEEMSLNGDLKLDSLDMISIGIATNDRLSINLEPSEIAPVSTVGDLVSLLLSKTDNQLLRAA